jgi:multidrug efflux pump subunit AcrB
MGAHPLGDAQQPGGLQLSTGGSHLAEVTMEFENLQERAVSSEEIADRWRQRVGTVPGVRRLTFDAVEGDDVKDFHLRLASKRLDDIESAARDLKQALGGYAGMYEINDTLGTRQPEITLQMKPAAETLGLRRQDLARQVRQAFYGEEAQRVQRGRDDIRVMVRYPLDQRRSIADLRNMRVRTVAGDEVPLTEVAEIEFGQGMAAIRRSERKRVVDVTAMLQREVVDNPDGIMQQLEAGILAELPQRYPGLTWSVEGGMKDQRRVMKELGIGFVVAVFAMYAMMAIAFNSYVQPLLIAAAIPFGFVGAVAGHALLDETVSIISFLGLVALAGVVVNDSLVLVDATNRITGRGTPIHDAVRTAAQMRFRAILLSSLTTFVGLTPMMLETSVQARFIVPMAVALAFGVAFATLITLTLIPALYLMIDDLKRLPRLLSRE